MAVDHPQSRSHHTRRTLRFELRDVAQIFDPRTDEIPGSRFELGIAQILSVLHRHVHHDRRVACELLETRHGRLRGNIDVELGRRDLRPQVPTRANLL